MSGEDGSTGEPLLHGGDLREAQALFPEALQPWIDLSTGINPQAYPVSPLPPENLARLPARAEVDDLEAAAAEAYRVADARFVAATPGTQALIQILPRLRQPGRVAVVAPTYGEHARSWSRTGHAVVAATSLGGAAAAAPDVIVVVNPNNPDGRRTAAAELMQVGRELASRGAWLVIDEAFADLEEAVSLAPLMPQPGVILLRSFGKTYGLAGVRLGFAVAEERLLRAVRAELGPWAVSGPAIAIGRTALRDRTWRMEQAARLARSAERLDAMLGRAGFEILGGTRLFRLARHRQAVDWFVRFGRHGLWLRRFMHDDSLLRFGIPDQSGWDRLGSALDI